MAGISVVAKKEFFDHVMGKKFMVILAILMIISLLAMQQGVESYNKQLDSYKERTAEIVGHPEGMPPGGMPEKPSMLFVFQMMSMLFGILGAILAIAIGFNLISGEKESGSLKSLLSHPVFRDTIINGKALGGMGALGFAMLVMTLLRICADFSLHGIYVVVYVLVFCDCTDVLNGCEKQYPRNNVYACDIHCYLIRHAHSGLVRRYASRWRHA
jgi:ABC-type transport system involved in multi-copper enzyme maturation permease subunit